MGADAREPVPGDTYVVAERASRSAGLTALSRRWISTGGVFFCKGLKSEITCVGE